jgi:cytochrome c biogenesis protein CcdA
MMAEGQYSRPEVYESGKGFRDFIGIILIVVGVVIALLAVINVYKIFTNPQGIEVFKQIIPDNPETRELDIGGEKVILPKGIFLFMAYSIGCLLLFIAASIATALITSGVNLLQSNFHRLEQKINKEISSLKSKMEEITEVFKKKSDSG